MLYLLTTAAPAAQGDPVALAMVLVLAVIFVVIGIIIGATMLVNYLFSE